MESLQWLLEIELDTLEDIDCEMKRIDDETEPRYQELQTLRNRYINDLINNEDWKKWIAETDKWILDAYNQKQFTLEYEIIERPSSYYRGLTVYLTTGIHDDIYIQNIFEAIMKAVEKFDRNYPLSLE